MTSKLSLDLGITPGELAFLQQGYRNNWQQYLATLNGLGTPVAVWDLCVLTASNARQAAAYQAQIDARHSAGLLPPQARFLVVPDPEGLRPGSGGATLRVLSELALKEDLANRRTLIIHSGGDSRRLPHCSAIGKLFARVPHEFPDGRPSSLFDEFLVSLSGLPGQTPAGVLVASGDVLLLFDHLQLSLSRPGVTGVAMAAPAETGTHHGVYIAAASARRVHAFLHKPPLEQMRAENALDGQDRVAIDTGLVWLDRTALECTLDLAGSLAPVLAAGVTLNLYGDLLAPLAAQAVEASYLVDQSDGPTTPALQEARRQIWSAVRGLPFSVESLAPAAFVHFGTTQEYLQFLHDGVSLLGPCGWHACTASWVPLSPTALSVSSPSRSASSCGYVAVNASLGETFALGERVGPGEASNQAACLLDSRLDTIWQVDGAASGVLLSHVVTEREALLLRDGIALDQLPVQGAPEEGWVTRLYGVTDDPKRSIAQGGTFTGRPWEAWLAHAGLAPTDLWPDTTDPAAYTLWDARLYPRCAGREASLDAVLWLQDPTHASADTIAAWRAAPRLSLAQSYPRADVGLLVQEQGEIEDIVRARRFGDGVDRQRPAATLVPILGQPQDAARRSRLVADWLEASIDPWLPMRGYRALAVATGDRRWEERAFSSLARLVRAHTPSVAASENLHRLLDLATPARPSGAPHGEPSTYTLAGSSRAAARIDFGGGWTDTPPHSLERGGTVLNAAIGLQGELPIAAEATLAPRTADEPALVLYSRDLDATRYPTHAGEILAYANPADPYALLKAAIVFRGLVPTDAPPETEIASLYPGWQLRLATATTIPRGSGLGTSSILGGAVLRALDGLLGRETPQARLFDEVLCLEQMITTAGGWQDQIGGLAGGIKLITTAPGLPQQFHIETLALSPHLSRKLSERLVILYTGQQRLAKNILRVITGRYMAREPEMLACLEEIASLARAMHRALLDGNLDALGELMDRHWQVNKRMDPGCTNPFIDELFALCRPYWVGAKLAGAGGGGFALCIVRDSDAAGALAHALAQRYPQGQVGLWHSHIADSIVPIGK